VVSLFKLFRFSFSFNFNAIAILRDVEVVVRNALKMRFAFLPFSKRSCGIKFITFLCNFVA